MEKKKVATHRVITMLDRQEIEFLDKLGKDALFSTGHKLSYNDVLKGLIDVAMEVGVSADQVGSLEAFKGKLVEEIRKFVDEELKRQGKA